MKNILKGYAAGVLSTALLVGGIAYAASTVKTIDVTYDNIKVYKDNVLCETKDANGTVVEPFIYNGTTYMPVRGTANLAGMDVTWDGATKSVYLWDELTADDTLLVEVCPPYDTDHCETSLSSEGESFEMAGKKYSNGLATTRHAGHALFNLDSKYNTLNCVVGHTDYNGYNKTITFVVDGKTVKTVELEAECMPKEISVPLNDGLQLKIVTSGEYTGRCPVGIANMIVK